MWEAGAALRSVEKSITQERVDDYAEASGDFNPIHLDHDFAAGTRFGRTIAHGMLVAASISEMMTSSFGLDWHRSGRMKLRFKAPVFPGDTATAFGEVKAVSDAESDREVVCTVSVRRQTGEEAISGEARVIVRNES